MNETKRLVGKVGFVLCSALLGMLAGHTAYAAEVSVDVGVAIHTESDFYEPLTPQGEWVVVGSYGRCWRPSRVEVGWRPYCNGSWQRTDAGWYWVSDEPWGWATYHYGRWDIDAQFGWFWVPQTVWAPAWVSWQEGGGYIGWAPLSPSGRIDVTINSPRVVLVEERRFLDPIRPTTVVVNNTTIINKTVINKGPDTVVIEKASGRKLQAVPVHELRSKEEAKVVVKHATPTSTSEKAVQTTVRSQIEKALPVSEPQPPAAKKEVPQADEQSRVAKLDAEKRAQQEKARVTESEKKQPAPAAVEAKPETKPETKHEAKPAEAKVEPKPAAERPAPTKEPTEQKPGKDDEKKD